MESSQLGMAAGSDGDVLLYDRANGAQPWSLLTGLESACPAADLTAVAARGQGTFAVAAGNCVAGYDTASSTWTPLINNQPAGVTFRDLAVGQGHLWAAGDNNGLGTVVRLADGMPLTIANARETPPNFGLPTFAWQVPDAALDERYEVTIDGVSSAPQSTYVFQVVLVDCP